MKKFYILCLMAMASSLAMANELVATATKLEKNKVVEEASDTAKWTFPGSVGLNLNQMAFGKYSTEGEGASVALDAFLNLNAIYTKNKVLWENSLSAKYGMIYSNQYLDPYFRKNLDELILNSKYGYKVSKAWYVSTFANLETQFARGYEYEPKDLVSDSKTLVSHYFAPAFIKISLGMEYIPNKYFSAFVSPVTARLTVCRIDTLGGRYGMEFLNEKIETLENGEQAITKYYDKFRAEVGAYFKLKSDFDITKSLHLFSTLEGFYSYNKAVQTFQQSYIKLMESKQDSALKAYAHDCWIQADKNEPYADYVPFDPETVSGYAVDDRYKDVHGWYLKWKLELLMKVSKYVNISFKTQLKYDNAESKRVERDWVINSTRTRVNENGETVQETKDFNAVKCDHGGLQMPGLQFWESTSIGVAYTFK